MHSRLTTLETTCSDATISLKLAFCFHSGGGIKRRWGGSGVDKLRYGSPSLSKHDIELRNFRQLPRRFVLISTSQNTTWFLEQKMERSLRKAFFLPPSIGDGIFKRRGLIQI